MPVAVHLIHHLGLTHSGVQLAVELEKLEHVQFEVLDRALLASVPGARLRDGQDDLGQPPVGLGEDRAAGVELQLRIVFGADADPLAVLVVEHAQAAGGRVIDHGVGGAEDLTFLGAGQVEGEPDLDIELGVGGERQFGAHRIQIDLDGARHFLGAEEAPERAGVFPGEELADVVGGVGVGGEAQGGQVMGRRADLGLHPDLLRRDGGAERDRPRAVHVAVGDGSAEAAVKCHGVVPVEALRWTPATRGSASPVLMNFPEGGQRSGAPLMPA